MAQESKVIATSFSVSVNEGTLRVPSHIGRALKSKRDDMFLWLLRDDRTITIKVLNNADAERLSNAITAAIISLRIRTDDLVRAAEIATVEEFFREQGAPLK